MIPHVFALDVINQVRHSRRSKKFVHNISRYLFLLSSIIYPNNNLKPELSCKAKLKSLIKIIISTITSNKVETISFNRILSSYFSTIYFIVS